MDSADLMIPLGEHLGLPPRSLEELAVLPADEREEGTALTAGCRQNTGTKPAYTYSIRPAISSGS